jgi:hypothetical protein
VAAVVAGQPQFAGYRLVGPPPNASAIPGSPRFGPPNVAERSVLAEQMAGGYRLIFVTGSGDCPSGCTIHRYDVFVVRSDGTVVSACVVDRLPAPPGMQDPCAAG